MKLVFVVLPLMTALAAGVVIPSVAPPSRPPALSSVPPLIHPAPVPNGDTQYKGARIMVRSMTHIPPCGFVFDFRPGPARVNADDDAKRQLDRLKQRQQQLDDLFKQRQGLPNAGKPPAPR